MTSKPEFQTSWTITQATISVRVRGLSLFSAGIRGRDLGVRGPKMSIPPYKRGAVNRVCESSQEFVFDQSKCFVYSWFTSVWRPSNIQADAAFIIEIGCTSKVLERFLNDRIIVKTGLAWFTESTCSSSAVLCTINRHSNICTRAYQGLRSSGPQR